MENLAEFDKSMEITKTSKSTQPLCPLPMHLWPSHSNSFTILQNHFLLAANTSWLVCCRVFGVDHDIVILSVILLKTIRTYWSKHREARALSEAHPQCSWLLFLCKKYMVYPWTFYLEFCFYTMKSVADTEQWNRAVKIYWCFLSFPSLDEIPCSAAEGDMLTVLFLIEYHSLS